MAGSAQGSAGDCTRVCVCPGQRGEVVTPGCSCFSVCPWQLCPGKCPPMSLRQQWAAGAVQQALCIPQYPPFTPLSNVLGTHYPPSVCPPWDGGTTHLFTSTVVRVKGTPLSSSTMKSRWQKGQWPTLSPSSLACRQRGRAQLLLRPNVATVGAAPAGHPWWVQGEGDRVHCTSPWPSPGWPQAGEKCWWPVAPAIPGRVPAPGPRLLPGPLRPSPAACVAQRALAMAPQDARGAPGCPSPSVLRRRGLVGSGGTTVVVVAGDSPARHGLCQWKVVAMLVALSPPGKIPSPLLPCTAGQTAPAGRCLGRARQMQAGRCCRWLGC